MRRTVIDETHKERRAYYEKQLFYYRSENTVEGEKRMNHEEVVAGLSQEFRRGTLIMLVLSQLKEPMYGYNLVKVLDTKSGLIIMMDL